MMSKCPDCKLETWRDGWGCDNCGLKQEDLEAAYEWWKQELADGKADTEKRDTNED